MPSNTQPESETIGLTMSLSRSGRSWAKNKEETQAKNVPRLIVCVLGGVTYSEMRCAYEVTRDNKKGFEVICGGSTILTPSRFLDDVKSLSTEAEPTYDE